MNEEENARAAQWCLPTLEAGEETNIAIEKSFLEKEAYTNIETRSWLFKIGG